MRYQIIVTLVVTLVSSAVAFAPHRVRTSRSPVVVWKAGGFDWEDPVNTFDQGVDNPYKNTGLTIPSDGGMTIDPARLLSPRLNGSNLYLIGMMGSGKTSVGEVIAKSKLLRARFFCHSV